MNQQAIYLNAVGNFAAQKNYTEIRFEHSNGNSFFASAQKINDNKIDFTFIDVLKNIEIANFFLLRDTKRNGWVKDTQNLLETSMVIPLEVTLNDLCVGFWCAYMVGETYKAN